MQKKDTGHIYAMKILRKADMLEKEQVGLYTIFIIINTMFFVAYSLICNQLASAIIDKLLLPLY